jgi:hypothetical protein
MKLSKREQDKLAEIVSGRLHEVISGRAEKMEINKRLNEAGPIPTERAARMVGRVNTAVVTKAVSDAVLDDIGTNAAHECLSSIDRKLPKIIADVFGRFAVENEFGDTFTPADIDELEATFEDEIVEIQMQFVLGVSSMIAEYAKKIAGLSLDLTGTSRPMRDEPEEELP